MRRVLLLVMLLALSEAVWAQRPPSSGDRDLALRAVSIARQGRLAEAALLWSKAARNFEKSGDERAATEAVGLSLTLSREHSPLARADFAAFKSLFTSPGNRRDSLQAALGTAEVLEQEGRDREMNRLLGLCAQCKTFARDRLLRAKANRVRAMQMLDRGENDKAADLLASDLQTTSSLAPNSLELADCYDQLAALDSARGDSAKELSDLRTAEEIQERISPDSDGLAQTYTGLGDWFLGTSQVDDAKRMYGAANEILMRNHPISVPYGLLCTSRAILAFALGDVAGAARLFSSADRVLGEVAPNSADRANECLAAGVRFYIVKRHTEAGKWLVRSSSIFEYRDRSSLDFATSLGYQGLADCGVSNWNEAITHLETARRIVLSKLSSLPTIGAKELLEERQIEQIEALALAYHEAGEDRKALEAANERGRVTAEWFLDRNYDLFGHASPEERRESDRLLHEVFVTQDVLACDPASMESQGLRSRINLDLASLRALTSKVTLAHPYPKVDRSAYDEAKTRAALEPGTLLMQYVYGAAGPMLLTLSSEPGSLRVYPLNVSEDDLYALCQSFEAAVANQGDFLQQGHALYDILVRPAEKEIARCKRILLCPQHILNELPFSALVVSAEGASFQPTPSVVQDINRGIRRRPTSGGSQVNGKITYFGDLRPIHRTLSVELYDIIRKSPRQKTSLAFLGLGRPDYHGLMPDLASTEPEVKGAAALLNGEALTGAKANLENFYALAPKARILHLACHGEAFAEDPTACALLLSAEDNKVGVLSAFEIKNRLKLNADLVVLSACESGLGRVMLSEGVDGFVRLFEYAGAKSVVSSLWPVADSSAAVFMERFYKGLAAGETKDVALQQAGLETRKRFSHPFYWAPFVLDGDYK